ncbi:FUSC family protein [Streptomyces sp. NPDC096310]|uniref:FUSC family protein n=1 Tax=Streptomyces sp. NPDC096310 TaxID=3366082 RepID=UPI00380A7147
MSWLRALRETALSGFSVERRRLEPLVALRGAAGLAVVVCGTFALFGPTVAASAAFGAFQAGIATFQRSWRPRPVLALASGASLAVSTFLGYVTGAHFPLFLALLALWTFLAGLAWTAGPTAGVIASSNVAIMLVTVTLPTSVATAAGHAAVIAAGGLVQAGMIVLFPVRRWGLQRDALADALAALGDYARRLRHDPTAPFDPEPLMTARSAAAVTPWQARRRPAELHGARGLAERIRPVLASLADPEVGVAAEGPDRDRVRELLAAAGSVLDSTARAVRHGTPVHLAPAAVAGLRTPDTESLLTGPAHRAATRLVSLLDLLDDVVETDVVATDAMTGTGTGTGTSTDTGTGTSTEGNANGARHSGTTGATGGADDRPSAARPATHRDRPGLLRLLPVVLRDIRGELHRDSPILRHAVRVTTVTCAGYVLGAALPLGHGYWAPMTVVMVMRPDFLQTYGRSVARFGGTLVGVALATGIVQAAHPGGYVSAALAVVSAGLMYLLLRTGYAISQIFVSAYVVFLLGMAGAGVSQTVRDRALLTLLGGLLAMIAYAVFPAWETPRLRARLADWLLADGRYAAAVVGHYARPGDRGGPDAREVRETLLATRTARVAWHTSEERAMHEPVRHRGLSRTAADHAEHALAQLARVAMLMEAHLPERGVTPVPAAAGLAETLREATERGAKDVRERRVPRWDAVREELARWDGEGVPDQVVRSGAGLLLDALEELSAALEEGADGDRGGERAGNGDGPRPPEGSAARAPEQGPSA